MGWGDRLLKTSGLSGVGLLAVLATAMLWPPSLAWGTPDEEQLSYLRQKVLWRPDGRRPRRARPQAHGLHGG